MSTNQRCVRLDGPIALLGVQVGMAYTGTFELDETFTRLELGGLDDGVVVLDFEVSNETRDDRGRLGLGDGGAGGHG